MPWTCAGNAALLQTYSLEAPRNKAPLQNMRKEKSMIVQIEGKPCKVINCDPTGMGDLLAAATIAESVRGQSPELRLSAHDAQKRMLLKMFGFPVENRLPVRAMVDCLVSFDWELANPLVPRILARARGLGYSLSPEQIKLPVATIPEQAIDWAKGQHRKDRPLVLLFPLSAYRNREWPASYWIDLGWRLEEAGYEVKTFIPAPDDRFQEAPSMYHSRSIHDVAAMMRESSLVIGNDSGPVWLAGTLGLKSLALFGPTGPSLYAHLPHVDCISGELECSGCWYQAPDYRKACGVGCMSLLGLPVKKVFDRACKLLGG